MVLYVGDILFASSDLGLLNVTKNYLSKNFAVKDMDEVIYVTGIKIFRDRLLGILGLSHKDILTNILKDMA